jgi:CHAD domain-containing protein
VPERTPEEEALDPAYFDTPGRRLARADATLGRRFENGGSVWSLRVPRSGNPPLELEAAGGPTPPPQLTRLLGAFLRQDELEPVPEPVTVENGQDSGGRADSEPTALLRAMLAHQYAEILRHDPGVRLAQEPEDLHRMRVAVRRTRAVLRAARPAVDRDWSEPLRAELKWLGGMLGPRRDLDVLLDRLRQQIAELDEPERSAAAPLVSSLEGERDRAQSEVAGALASDRYAGLLDRLEEGSRSLEVTGELSLRKLATREFKRLRKRMKALGTNPSDEELHRARILGKRARYAAELAEPEAGKKARRFVARARAFQDVLGSHQDAIVAEARLRELLREAGETGAAFAAGRLVERERLRRRDARRALPKAWRKLEGRGLRAWS